MCEGAGRGRQVEVDDAGDVDKVNAAGDAVFGVFALFVRFSLFREFGSIVFLCRQLGLFWWRWRGGGGLALLGGGGRG